MPKVSKLQPSFTAGEISPSVYGRIDSDRYKAALQTCVNYIPMLQGPVTRRPGTKFANYAADQNVNTPPALIPYVLSQSSAYMLEFGTNYIRFWSNGAKVIANSSVNAGSFYWVVQGVMTNDNNHYFWGARYSNIARQGEILQTNLQKNWDNFYVPSPYAGQDVPNIKWAQNGASLYLYHPNYPTMKLTQYAANDWKLEQVYFQDGPYLPLNTYSQLADGAGVTLTCALGVGATFINTGPSYSINNVVFNGTGSTGQYRVTTSSNHQFVSGQKVYVGGVTMNTTANTNSVNNYSITNSSTTSPNYYNAVVVNSTTIDLGGSIVNSTAAFSSGGTINAALFLSEADVGKVIGLIGTDTGQRFWGSITAWTNAHSCSFSIDSGNTITETSACSFWFISPYGGGFQQVSLNNATIGPGLGSSNYPATGCFHQNRQIVAGSPNYPQEFDGSQIGFPESFAPSVATGSTALQVQANNGFSYNLVSQDIAAIRWLKSTTQGLLAGSQSYDWVITPSAQSAGLTPTSINAQQMPRSGSANVDAAQIGNAAVYVHKNNRKLKELNYFFQAGTFRSSDMSELADHMLLPSITKLAVQTEPQPIVWAVRSDGALLSMTYNRDDLTVKAPWARHFLGGTSDGASIPLVKSIGFIPDATGTFDQMYLVTQRYIATSSAYNTLQVTNCVEYMTNFFLDNTRQDDAFHYDFGSTYDNPLSNFLYFNFANQISTPYVIVNANNHGLANCSAVKVTGVIGFNQVVTDINGDVATTNLVNERVFTVASSTTNTFLLADFNGNFVQNTSYTPYISGGQIRQLVTSISGLQYLSGQTVSVLTDGANHPDVAINSSGILSLSYPAAKVQIGLSYKSQGATLPASEGSAQGSAIGSFKRINRFALMLHNVGDIKVGYAFTQMVPQQLTQADVQKTDTATPLFSGIIQDGLEAPSTLQDQFCWQQSTGLPGMVQAVTLFLEENDV